MNEFLNVIRDINWDMLHRQKEELLDIVTSDSMDVFKKQDSELDGLLNLIDALQDVAAKLRIWTFPSERYEGNCPECGSKNFEFLEEKGSNLLHECYDCGYIFNVKSKNDLIVCEGCLKEEYHNAVVEVDGKYYCETCDPERDHTDDICPCGDVDCSRPWGHE